MSRIEKVIVELFSLVPGYIFRAERKAVGTLISTLWLASGCGRSSHVGLGMTFLLYVELRA